MGKKQIERKQYREITAVLEECKTSAKNGYKIASGHYEHLRNALYQTKEQIQNTILEYKSSSCKETDLENLLGDELAEINNSFDDLIASFKEDVENLRENLSIFSVTLFGRTMAGKSTLMEIMTHGDGESIGKGAQRTTRDVREYEWHGLHITDVPGISAFEGAEDEITAFEAAKRADIILFLITDDGPQATEADFLERVIGIGKPVIIVMNIKKGILENKTPEINLKRIEKAFDMDRLSGIRNQLLAYSATTGQDWQKIPVVYVHLQSAFKSQHIPDKQLSRKFYEVSRFNELEKMILKTVKQKGSFYRTKSFVDMISVPLIRSMDMLLEQSETNNVQGRILGDKIDQLEKWRTRFTREGNTRIESLLNEIRSRLELQIPEFVENHFSDRKADKAWKQLLESEQIDIVCRDMLNDLDEKCNGRIVETRRQIEKELEVYALFTGSKNLRMKPIIDSKKILAWGGIVVGAAVTIAGFVLGAVPAGIAGTVGLAGAGISFIASFITSRNKQEDKARSDLEKKLRKNIEDNIEYLHKILNNSFHEKILKKAEIMIEELSHIRDLVFSLSDTQRDLSWKLNRHVLDANNSYITEALKYIGAEGMQYHISQTARKPGTAVAIELYEGKVFPDKELGDLKKLLLESIFTINRYDDPHQTIAALIGGKIMKNSIQIEEKNGIAHINNIDDSSQMIIRANLAQQLTGLQIMK